MEKIMTINKKPFSLSEDWTVVLCGGLLIAIALLGISVPSPVFAWKSTSELAEKVLNVGNFGQIALLFTSVYSLALLATWALGNSLKNWNLEAVIISLSLGLLLSNFFQLPAWLLASLSTELFVKIGLVLLGTSVIFGDILKAGSLGLIQALIVVISVWYFAFWVCKKMGVDEEMAIMISSGVSICGVSAAIATSGAIMGDPKKLSYVISVVLITAIPMIIFLPLLAQFLGLSQEVTGAWLGGTIDTTGAVIASGSLVGETALKISTIVKFSQNVLLGLAAFAISIYWTYRKKDGADVSEMKPTVGVIWERFPKFVLGFIAASLLFSFVVPGETLDSVKGPLKSLQGLWFALAFTSIGLETKFADLFKQEGRKPLYAFLIAQAFNVVLTLGIAYVLFAS